MDPADVVSLDLPEPFRTVHGGELPSIQVSYESWGTLSAASDYAVLVIDCAGDSVLTQLPFEDEPFLLCHHPGRNRLYVGCDMEDFVAVYDAGPDTLVKTIDLPGSPELFQLDSVNDLLWCAVRADDSCLVAIDCTGDSILDRLDFVDYPDALGCNPDDGIAWELVLVG